MSSVKDYFLFFVLFNMFGCQSNTVDFERTTVTINNQKFELITTYSIFDNYLSSQTGSDYTSASNNLIYEPIQKEIIDNAEAPFMFETIRAPYQPGKSLKNEIDLLKSSDVINIVKKSLSYITVSLPGPNTKIIIMPANPSMHDLFLKYNICMNAITLGSGKIIVMIDPTFNDWQKTLPYVIAHEYHHSAWISKHWKNADFSLIEYLIFEGRADAFATSLYNDVESPWTVMINREQEKTVWSQIEPDIFQRGHERINKVMFGSLDIPFGSGYTIGFNIVKSFKKNNPKYSDKEIIDLTPEEILTMSKYK
jgi:uncharacterized protein YjaZ